MKKKQNNKTSKKFTYIDLFSGCGGLSLGLYNAGWKGLFAIEKSEDAFATLQSNLIDKQNHFRWPRWLPKEPHDIRKILSENSERLLSLRGKVTLLTGGPPCQGFSMAGQRNEKDSRNKLMHSYIHFVDLVRPKVLFFENVKGFTISFKKKNKTKPYSDRVVKELKSLGYSIHAEILDFADYGIPQRRKRFILVGVLDEQPKIFFTKLKINIKEFLKTKGLKKRTPLKEVISDLLNENGSEVSPDSKGFMAGKYSSPVGSFQNLMRDSSYQVGSIADSHRFAKHGSETINLFENIIKTAVKNKKINGDERIKFGLKKRGITLLDQKSLSPTLTTHPDDYVHYSEPRILTVREYARIQTFPDWYEFKGRYTTGGERRKKQVPRYSQIGNAIPPLFGEQVGIALKEAFFK